MTLTYNDGLEASAQFLEKTAADFEDMARQHERTAQVILGNADQQQSRRLALESHAVARILRGQANHIRDRKLPAVPPRRV